MNVTSKRSSGAIKKILRRSSESLLLTGMASAFTKGSEAQKKTYDPPAIYGLIIS